MLMLTFYTVMIEVRDQILKELYASKRLCPDASFVNVWISRARQATRTRVALLVIYRAKKIRKGHLSKGLTPIKIRVGVSLLHVCACRSTMKETMKVLFLLSILACFASKALADITVVNSIVVPSEIYDFTYSNVSNVWWRGKNRTMYYCIFRNLWTKESAPNDYPKNARWTDPVLYVGTQSFQPWINGQAVSVGIGKIATVSYFFTQIFLCFVAFLFAFLCVST